MHEGKGLAGFPVAKDGVGVNLELCLGKDADDRIAPIGIRSVRIGNDGGFRFVSELGVLVEVDAGNVKLGRERDNRGGVARIDTTPRSVESVGKMLVVSSKLIGAI